MATRDQTVFNLRQLAIRRKALGQKPKRVSGRRLRIQYPKSLERQYRRTLATVVADLIKATNDILIPKIPELVKEYQSATGTTPQRADAWFDDLDDLLAAINLRISRQWTESELADIARRTGRDANSFAKAGLEKELERVLGVNIVTSEPWLKDVLDAFSTQNVNLIKSVQTRYFEEIRQRTFQGVSQGLRAEDISRQIQERAPVAASRADLIARDQVSKIVSQANMLQQQSLGVSKYEWSTSLDERVRDSHAAMEGTVHDWNDPPTVDGEPVHPGQAINCRCVAIPVMEELIQTS